MLKIPQEMYSKNFKLLNHLLIIFLIYQLIGIVLLLISIKLKIHREFNFTTHLFYLSVYVENTIEKKSV